MLFHRKINADYIALALDESTDNTDKVQLRAFVRYLSRAKGEICEDLFEKKFPERVLNYSRAHRLDSVHKNGLKSESYPSLLWSKIPQRRETESLL